MPSSTASLSKLDRAARASRVVFLLSPRSRRAVSQRRIAERCRSRTPVPPEGGPHVQREHLLVVGHSAGREAVHGLLLDPEIGVTVDGDFPVYVGREGLASLDEFATNRCRNAGDVGRPTV